MASQKNMRTMSETSCTFEEALQHADDIHAVCSVHVPMQHTHAYARHAESANPRRYLYIIEGYKLSSSTYGGT